MLVTAWEPGGGPGGGGPSSFGTHHRLCQLVTKIKDPDPGVKWNWDGWGTGEMSRRRTRVDGAPAGAEIPLAACRSAGDRGARYLLRVPRALLWSLLEILVPWGNPRVFRVGGGRWEASGGVLAEPGKPVRLSGCLAPVSHLTLLLGLGRLQRTRLGDFSYRLRFRKRWRHARGHARGRAACGGRAFRSVPRATPLRWAWDLCVCGCQPRGGGRLVTAGSPVPGPE